MTLKTPRYRKVYPRIWRHKDFIPLDAHDKVLVLYCLSGPQTNRIGFYAFSPGTASEELDIPLPDLKARLARICALFGWQFDAQARVMYIPSWWEWNRPENANVLRGALTDLGEVPESDLRDQWRETTANVCETYRVTFPERSPQRYPQRTPIQEQEQEQEQEVPPVAPLRGAIPMRPAKLRRRAEEIRRREWVGRCHHEPACATYESCIARLVSDLRTSQVEAFAEAERA